MTTSCNKGCATTKIDVWWRWRWRYAYVLLIYICLLINLPHAQSRLVCRTRLHEPRIYEGAPAGQYVMTVRAYDEFGADHIIYRLVTGKDMFFIEEDTGRINTAKKIDKKFGQVYNILVVAVSGGQTESCPLEVKVTRLNRYPPTFRMPLYRVEIPYVTPIRSVLLDIKATDLDQEDYNSEVYYFLSQITKEDRGHISSTTWSSSMKPFDGVKPEPDEWMSAELDREDESFRSTSNNSNQSFISTASNYLRERYLTIDRRSGTVYLNRALNKNVGLISAKVLVVDGGSPPRWAASTLEVLVKMIGPPLNVTNVNIAETNAKICWRHPNIGDPKGYLVRYRASKHSIESIQDHTMNVSKGATDKPSCVLLTNLHSASDYELKVYGWNDEEVGMGSEIVLFNTLTPRCPADNRCGNGTCHPGQSLTSVSAIRNYYCECQNGFYGDSCEHFNPCVQEPCQNMGTCYNTSDSTHRCVCVSGFYDEHCSSFDPCTDPNICQNSGTCVSTSSHTYECRCSPGFFGSKCERVDPCFAGDNVTCHHGGTCRNVTDDQFVCLCKPGYSGTFCESNIDECQNTVCLNGGTCVDGVDTFRCVCNSGYTGALCQDELNECISSPCQNDAKCEDRVNGFVCLCPEGFHGDLCDHTVNECEPQPCQNGGTCRDEHNHYKCLCPHNFQGSSCEYSAVCREEEIPGIRGRFSFKDTFANEVVNYTCPYGPYNVILQRNCTNKFPMNSSASWSPLNISACRREDEMEAENVTKRLLERTKNGSSLGSEVVNDVTDQIRLVLQYALRDSKIARFMFEVISNLLDANESVLNNITDHNSISAANRLAKIIEDFMETVEIDNELKIDTDNLILQIQMVPDISTKRTTNLTSDITFKGLPSLFPKQPSFREHNDVLNDVNEVPTLTVSSNVINKAVEARAEDIRLQFVAHRNAKLFRQQNEAGVNNALDRATLIDRPVFTVSVAKYNVTDISNGVNFSIKKPLVGKWLCAYWLMEGQDNGRWSTNGLIANQDDERVTCTSSHMTSFSILLDPDPDEDIDPRQEKALSIISYVGSGLSVLGLIFTILTFSMFRCLNRDRSGKILLNLCVSMLLLNVSFLSGAFKSDSLKKNGDVIESSNSTMSDNSTVSDVVVSKDPLCTAVAVFTHYFILTTLSWMSVEAINMYQLLIYVFATSETRFLLKRSFVAWGAPAVVVGITAAVNIGYYNPKNEYCMLSAVNPYVYYLTLIVPCCVLLIVNTIVFVMVTKVLFQPRNGEGKFPHKNFSSNKWKARTVVTFAQVRGAFTVMTLLGVTWVFGALAIGSARTIFQYIFCVFNSLQGFLVFIVRCLQYPEARSAWILFFRTGTLKKHRGTKVTTTSSNNSHVKLTLSNVASSNGSSTNASGQHIRDRSSSVVSATKTNQGHRRSIFNTPYGISRADEDSTTTSSWVYGGNGLDKRIENDVKNTKVIADANETKEGQLTNWEYVTWQQKCEQSLAQDENQSFKSVWMVPDASPMKFSFIGGIEDTPFIEEEDENGIEEKDVKVETAIKRGSKRGTLTDQGYSSAEHSPTSKREGGVESNNY